MVDFLPANHDFRGFAGFQHFDISNGKLLLGLLLPKAAVISRLYGNAIFLSPLHWWCPFGVPKSEFGSLAENGRFLNKPLIWKCYFLVPAALVPIWRPKINYLGALPKMVDFLISR